MPRAQWALFQERPTIEVVLTLAQGGQKMTRRLLADTGAGNARARFEMLLDETLRDDGLMKKDPCPSSDG